MVLNPQNAFGFPLCAEPLILVGLTSRAVANAVIDAVVRMAVLAMRLLRIDIGDGCGISLGILARGNSDQVLRIHARAIPASVIDDKAFRNRFIRQPHRDSMCAARRSSKSDDSIAISILMASPQEAISRWNAFRLETRDLCWSWAIMRPAIYG